MKPQLLVTTIVLLTHACASGQGAGPLVPPGPPADGAYHTLGELWDKMEALEAQTGEIEARTDLATVAGDASSMHAITNAGSYYLTGNLDVTKTNGIEIGSSNVTLDLNGFTLYRSSSASATGKAITLSGAGIRNVTIENGHITSAPLDGTGGSFEDRGFVDGIGFSTGSGGSLEPSSILVSKITVLGGTGFGILLSANFGSSSLVTQCAVRGTGVGGISADEVRHSSALDCGGDAIFARNLVSDSTGRSIGDSSSSIGIHCDGLVSHSWGSSVNGTGIRSASTVSYSHASGGATSLQANIAVGCTTAGPQTIAYKYLMP